MKKQIILLQLLGLATLITFVAPLAVNAQAQLEIKYKVAPSVSDQTVSTEARMNLGDRQISSTWCTEVGNVPNDKGCTRAANGDLAQAADDLYNAITNCVGTNIDLMRNKVEPQESCIRGKLASVDKYKNTAAAAAHEIAVSSTYTCVQCVGYVQASLILIGNDFTRPCCGGAFYATPPSGFKPLAKGEEALPGDIMVYGGPGAGSQYGHVGIVKKSQYFDPGEKIGRVEIYDANGDFLGGVSDPSTGGSCDLSNHHVLPYDSKDTSGTYDPKGNPRPRFLRKEGAPSGGGAAGNVAEKIKSEFKIAMTNFDDKHLNWAYQQLKALPQSYIELAHGKAPDSIIGIQGLKYTPADQYSEQLGCAGEVAKNINLRYDFPGSDSEEIFKITITHELGHMIQLCPVPEKSKYSQHKRIFDSELKNGIPGITYYAQHAGEAGSGCPTSGVSKQNEDYADMLTYVIFPNARQKDVCGKGRLENPYSNGQYPEHQRLAREILGL